MGEIFLDVIRVMVVDDSLIIRRIISDILKSEHEIELVGTASNGEKALNLIPVLKPDVLILDIQMPKVDGLTVLEEIMKIHPLPVIMFSALTQESAEHTFKALDLGAIDYIPKTPGLITHNIQNLRTLLVEKIIAAADANLQQKNDGYRRLIESFSDTDKVITIGASTGGPKAVGEVLQRLPTNIPPILIVQHMPKFFTKPFAERLDGLTSFRVMEAKDGQKICDGEVLIAPGDYHMIVKENDRIRLHQGPRVHYLRPTVDELMLSTARVYRERNVAVIMTGMGRDGVRGLHAIKESGGYSIAQNKESCVVYGMPKAAIESGLIDVVCSLDEIPEEIMKRCG